MEQFPDLGKIESALKQRPQSFRSLVVGHYKVIYFVDNEHKLEILPLYGIADEILKRVKNRKK